MKQLSSLSSSENRIKNQIKNMFYASKKLEQMTNCRIVEQPSISETWLVTEDNVLIRKICGHRGQRGPCFLSAGYGTNHTGKGKCKKHSRSLLYNPSLNALEGIPARFGELLEHVDTIEDGVMLNVDHEIKFLYALQQFMLTKADNNDLSLAQMEALQSITMDIVKTKSIKNKIQRELRLDASSVKEFVQNIFGVILSRVHGAEAHNILMDINNKVIVPYRNQNKISGDTFDFKEKIEKEMKKVGN